MHICSSSEYSSESRIPIINNPDEKTIYLVPASYQPSNNMFTEWVYVNNTWEIFGSVAVNLSGYLTDVQINGTSVVNDGVVEIPVIENLPNQNPPTTPGLIRLKYNKGFLLEGDENNKYLTINKASMQQSKTGTASDAFISCSNQHFSAFYGLAKAAGDTTQSQSSNVVGTYTDEAKIAIKNMLGINEGIEVIRLI